MKPPAPVPLIRDYLRILLRYWWIIAAVTVLSVGAGWIAHQTTGPKFVATSRILVIAPGSAEVSDVYNGHLAAAARAVTIQQLAKNPQVAKRTIDQLQLRQTPAELIAKTTAVAHDSVVEIHVTGDSPELAKDSAVSLTYNLVTLAQEMAAMDKSGSDVVLIDSPSVAYDSRAPLALYLQLGAALGLALSVLAVIALGRVRDSVLTEEQAVRIVGETVGERNA